MLCLNATAKPKADDEVLRKHVEHIAGGAEYRNHRNVSRLNAIADYIKDEMAKYSGDMSIQEFVVNGKKYKNVCASFGPLDAPRIIIGAHYDVCGDQMGADDNASGVAGLLELARLFGQADRSGWEYRIDLVAYTLEEPPYFDTDNMGSAIHAEMLKQKNVPVIGMISLEMIGYFDDAKNSQDYPLGILKMFYGSRGDYITVVRRTGGGKFARKFTKKYKHNERRSVTTKVFKAPLKWVPSISLSDHENYWKYDWSALMLTDTSFFRNKNYHEATDTPDTLDYKRMSAVVTKVFLAIQSMVA